MVWSPISSIALRDLDAFLEDADHREGDAADGDGLVDGGLRGAVELDREPSQDDRSLGVRFGVLLIEEAAGGDAQVAHHLVLRGDAEQHRLLGDSAAHADAVVELQHRRRRHDARHLDDHGTHIVAGHQVGRAGVIRPDHIASGVHHLHLVGADAGDGIERILLAGIADRVDEHDRGRTDNHAQHG